jgi:hypothetical protein
LGPGGETWNRHCWRGRRSTRAWRSKSARGAAKPRDPSRIGRETGQELADQATEEAQQQARRRRRKYRRTAKKQARKLDKRVTAAAKRLQVALPVEKRRRRGRRMVLFLVVVGGAVAAYLAWRSRQDQGPGEAAEAGPAPDAFRAAVEQDRDRTASSTDITST